MRLFPLVAALALAFSADAAGKKLYDFVVPRDGSFREAIEAANNRADTTARFRIFLMDGDYVIPTAGKTTGGDGKEYGDPRSWLKTPNVSIIGESREGTVLVNTTPPATWDNGFGPSCPLEGIGKGDVLIIEYPAHDTYLQDLTMKSGMADHTGRNIVLHDRSDKTIARNICIWGYQDTYVSNNRDGRFYFDGGVIRGRTDYICGKGDVYYDGVTFQQCGQGGYLAVPSVPRKYGYVMDRCYIKSETPDVTYYLGRPWGKGTPTAIWINTTVDVSPITNDKRGYNGWAGSFRRIQYLPHLRQSPRSFRTPLSLCGPRGQRAHKQSGADRGRSALIYQSRCARRLESGCRSCRSAAAKGCAR